MNKNLIAAILMMVASMGAMAAGHDSVVYLGGSSGFANVGSFAGTATGAYLGFITSRTEDTSTAIEFGYTEMGTALTASAKSATGSIDVKEKFSNYTIAVVGERRLDFLPGLYAALHLGGSSTQSNVTCNTTGTYNANSVLCTANTGLASFGMDYGVSVRYMVWRGFSLKAGYNWLPANANTGLLSAQYEF